MESISFNTSHISATLHPLIQKRWSPRSFSDQMIRQDALAQLLEAARWAPSSNNEQPWQYVYAYRGTKGFEQLWECLKPGNQPWTRSAAVLMVAMVRTTFAKNGSPNPWAEHDLGMANAQLLLQAADVDIYGHQMAGFDAEKVRGLLELDESVRPVCMMALGYLGDPEQLPEPYASREVAPRTRTAVESFTRKL